MIMLDLATTKVHDEGRQGEAYAAFENDPNQYKRKFFIESYGCAMNFSDSEIVASILNKEGFGATRNFEEADLIFLNTCSIREKAEQTVRKRLTEFKKLKRSRPSTLIGVLGCMAERLKSKFLEEEKLVDIVVGPDAYRTLPQLIGEAGGGQKAVNVLLSREETYADISPVRLNSNGITAFVSIMRGCNNMCSFCVVPFTRGRERSRDAQSIVKECQELFDNGYKEVTLLGQNVDSYYYPSPTTSLKMDDGAKAPSRWEGDDESSLVEEETIGYRYADPSLYALLKEFSLRHRYNSTQAEDVLWNLLKSKRLEDYKFRRQHIIDKFIADFVCLKQKLIIEVDGLVHQLPENQISDQRRTEVLNSLGFEVIRFNNEKVLNETDKVLNEILSALKNQQNKKSFSNLSSPTGGQGAITFAALLEMVALISPDLRIRFSTSHPKDITDEVLFTMAKYENICKYIHLPLQSGSTRVLQSMNRSYTREWYQAKVDRIREIMPDCGISSDVIAGFCTETEEDHKDTLNLMEYAKYDMSYMFFYSERPGTLAERRYKDDVPLDVKKRRLQEIVDLQGKLSHESNKQDLGKRFKVLIEASSKRTDKDWMGRNSQNKVIVFPKGNKEHKPGDYVWVKVTDCTQATLLGELE
jgi:tRNA A37 methylthiotransferase MiaB/very-short-patch-repair endonuclease